MGRLQEGRPEFLQERRYARGKWFGERRRGHWISLRKRISGLRDCRNWQRGLRSWKGSKGGRVPVWKTEEGSFNCGAQMLRLFAERGRVWWVLVGRQKLEDTGRSGSGSLLSRREKNN